VQAGLKFSEAVMMQDKNFDQVKYNKSSQTEFSDTEKEKLTQPINYLQIFNKFVLIEFADKILVVDQHAAAERVTFERLMQRDNKLEIVSQKLLIPLKLSFDGSRVEYIREQIEFFREIGFDIEFKNNEAIIIQVPADFVGADFEKMFTEIISDESKEPFARRKTDIIATMACHTSIRTGQKLVFDEIKSLWASLIRCENPYSCPHGRPIIWEIKLSDLDSKFER
jgi:DNA mismatch repair protein MutL